MSEANKTGWWNPEPLKRKSFWHFFGEDGRSLCGTWLHLRGELEQGNDNSPDNCKSCMKRLAKMKEKEAKKQ